MKVLVTGVGGQLGRDVVNELIARGHEAVGSDIVPVIQAAYVPLDITDGEHREGLQSAGLQADVHLHGLRIRRAGGNPVGAGLQGLRAAERVRSGRSWKAS